MQHRHRLKRTLKTYLIVILALVVCFGGFVQSATADDPAIWEIAEHPYSNSDITFQDVVFINRTHGWVVGITTEGIGGGVILHSNDSGVSWHEQHHDSEQAFRQIAVIDDLTLWVTGRGGLVYTTDGGKQWINSTTIGPGASGLGGVIFSNATHGWTSTYSNLYTTTDAGQSWENVSSWVFDDNARDFHIRNSEIWVIGFYGIYYSNDFGVEWKQLYTHGGWSMSFVETGGAWAVDDNLLASSFDGYTWSSHALPRPSPFGGYYPPYFSDVFFVDPYNGWLGGLETPITYTPNGGLDWYDQGVEIDTRINGLEFINQTHGWAVGSDGTILRTTKGNEIGARLWRGLTDYVILIPIGATIIGIVAVVMLYRRRRMPEKPLSKQIQSSGTIDIE
ncbi:MAG: YCF48-related protein [Candidatus Thorarchaeota archaeon]|nr:YCF48-related protein [Candidatus Thorarchaeota archaeon]